MSSLKCILMNIFPNLNFNFRTINYLEAICFQTAKDFLTLLWNLRLSPLWSETYSEQFQAWNLQKLCLRVQHICSILVNVPYLRTPTVFAESSILDVSYINCVKIVSILTNVCLLFLQALEVSVCPRKTVELFCFDLPANFTWCILKLCYLQIQI